MTEPAEPTDAPPAPHLRPAFGGPPPVGYPGPPPTGYYAPPPGTYAPPPPGYPPPGYGMMAPPALAPDGRPLAGFGDRLVARLLDGLILGMASLVLVIPVVIVIVSRAASLAATDQGGTTGVDGGFLLTILGLEAAWFVLILAATYVYEVEMLYRSGQTIGKRVMKIKIIPLRPGAPLTRGAAAKRWLIGQIAAAFVPFFSWIDGLWQLWDKPYQQCLHDKVAGTVVVKLH